MLKIWGRKTSSNVRKILWCCVELNLEYDRIDWTGPFGGNDDPAYRKLNPNGLVPTIEDGDLVLWESNTILRYLTHKHSKGNLWPEDAGERGRAEMWMDWQLSVINPVTSPIFRGIVHTPENQRDHAMIKEKSADLCTKWAMFDNHLAGKDFVLGKNFSMADIAMGVHANRFIVLVEDRPPLKNLVAWHKRIGERPGFAEHVPICP